MGYLSKRYGNTDPVQYINRDIVRRLNKLEKDHARFRDRISRRLTEIKELFVEYVATVKPEEE